MPERETQHVQVLTEESPESTTVTVGTTTVPDWLRDADEEERRELEALGVLEVVPPFDEEAQRDVQVSTLLRAAHEHTTDAARYDAAEVLEHAAIKSRYDRLRQPAQNQLRRLGSFILHLATGAVFSGKAKSRTVGWGAYGRKKKADGITISDEAAMVAWLREHHPILLTVDVGVQLDQVERASFAAMKLQPGELPKEIEALLAACVFASRDVGYSKSIVKALALGNAKTNVPGDTIPGVEVVRGADEPWFEVEAPQ